MILFADRCLLVCNRLLAGRYYQGLTLFGVPVEQILICSLCVTDIFGSPSGNETLHGKNPEKGMERSAFYFCFLSRGPAPL